MRWPLEKEPSLTNVGTTNPGGKQDRLFSPPGSPLGRGDKINMFAPPRCDHDIYVLNPRKSNLSFSGKKLTDYGKPHRMKNLFIYYSKSMLSDSRFSIFKPMPPNGVLWVKLDMLLRRNYYCHNRYISIPRLWGLEYFCNWHLVTPNRAGAPADTSFGLPRSCWFQQNINISL